MIIGHVLIMDNTFSWLSDNLVSNWKQVFLVLNAYESTEQQLLTVGKNLFLIETLQPGRL